MSIPTSRMDLYKTRIQQVKPIKINGKVTQVIGVTIESQGPAARIGDLCKIVPTIGRSTLAEVVGFRDQRVVLMPLSDVSSIGPGSEVVSLGDSFQVSVGTQLLGRILDGLGQPMDQGIGLSLQEVYPTYQKPPNPLSRPRITEVQSVGVRAIDSMLTLGRGQRMGVFAGSGVGKSTL